MLGLPSKHIITAALAGIGGLAALGCGGDRESGPLAFTIALDTVAIFDASVITARSLDPLVARSSSGIYAVVPDPENGRILLLDGEGAQIDEFGRRGEGPFEFSDIGSLHFGAGDTLLILDNGNLRLNTFTSTGVPVRYARIEGPAYEVRQLLDGTSVLQGVVPVGDLAGFRVRLLQDEGEVGLAEVRKAYDVSDHDYGRYPIAIDGDAFWLLDPTSYALERHESGAIRGTDPIVVERPWFRPAKLSPSLVGIMDPHPTIIDSHLDGSGNLWVLGIKPVVPDPVPAPDEIEYSYESIARFTNHVLEVIDPTTGAVLASQTFPLLPLRFLDRDHAYVPMEADDGDISIAIVRYSLPR